MSIRKIAFFLLIFPVIAAAAIGIVTQPLVTPIKSEVPAVDPKRLEAHVKYLSVDLYPRNYQHQENLEATAQYIMREFEKAGAKLKIQDVLVEAKPYKNIIAQFGPSDGPLLVVGAHYDSHGDTPGADDNASGVAGLIELAQLLGKNPPRQSVQLVAYTLEEPPFFRTEHMGSAWHARSLTAEKREVRLMVSLEMIGYFSDAPGSQQYPVDGMSALYSDRGNFVALVGKMEDFDTMRRAKAVVSGASDLPVFSINAPPSMQGIDFSDHMSYWNEGFPAMMMTDTAFMRNKNYHRAEDTYEKLDYVRMAKVVQGAFAITQNH